MLSRFEVANELEDNLDQILQLVSDSRTVLRNFDREAYRDANASVFSQIDGALNDNHEWVGRNMVTFEKIISGLRENDG
jgi:hypothetical protein|tara:strand:+ start:28 stop:264 length:237 start_codon:yes stop_codon:yes gene_type:complete